MSQQPAPRVAFVLPNPRAELAAAVARGEAPDSTLLGWNHMAGEGLEGILHDPWLTRHVRGGTPLHRVAWNLREVLLPFELTDADAVFTPLAAAFPLVARVRRLPVVVVNYGLCLIHERAGRGRRALLAANLKAAHSVVCLGESQRLQLIEQTGLDPARVHTVNLGIDAGWFVPRPGPEIPGAPAADPAVLAVGKDLARDYRTLVEAVQPLGVRTHIAGYRRNVTGLDLPAGVTAGDMPIAELREAYARAGVVVVPQFRDGYAYGSEGGGLTALLEAMAMGRPLVVSDRGILRDFVRDGVEALVVPPEDPAALREAIARVLGDPELAANLGAAARARVEERFTSQHFAAGIAPLLHAAAAH